MTDCNVCLGKHDQEIHEATRAGLGGLPMMEVSHTSVAHAKHTKPCGCAVNPDKAVLICTCGAAYVAGEDGPQAFPIWRCYDCGKNWINTGVAGAGL